MMQASGYAARSPDSSRRTVGSVVSDPRIGVAERPAMMVAGALDRRSFRRTYFAAVFLYFAQRALWASLIRLRASGESRRRRRGGASAAWDSVAGGTALADATIRREPRLRSRNSGKCA